MGTTTPNMSIYIVADGETNYGSAVANGMLNIDAHDHSGAPNKGVPITASGIASGAIDASKLNSSFFSVGTFTPTVQSTNSDLTGISYSLQDGNYQRIGDWLMIDLEIIAQASGGTGNWLIQGLPFASVGGYWFTGYLSNVLLNPKQQVCSYQTSNSTDVNIYPVSNSTPLPQGLAVVTGTPYNFQLTGIYKIV